MNAERLRTDPLKKDGSKEEPFKAGSDAGYAALHRSKLHLGLAYGMLAGLSFAISTWGIDALLLAKAHADLAGLKFLIGGLFCISLGGASGWLGEKAGSALVTFLAWLATGGIFAWFTSHLPFEIFTAVAGLLDPDFRGINLYPYSPNVDRRMVVIYILVFLVSGLVGALQNNMVESARGAFRPVPRFLALGACIPLMFLAGNSADNVNEPLRNAVVGVNTVIENALQAEVKPVDKKTAAEMRLRAVAPVSNLLHRPRRLILGSYDPQDLDGFGVYIDFNGTWATCSVLIDSPSNCKLSDDIYPAYFTCLLRGDQGDACQPSAAEAAGEWLKEHAAEIGPAPLVQVAAQRGDATLLDVLGQDHALYRCRFSGIQFSSVLQGCKFLSGNGSEASFLPTATPTPVRLTLTPLQPTPVTPSTTPVEMASATPTGAQAATLSPTDTLPATPSASAVAPLESLQDVPQTKAMLPETQKDLEELGNLSRYFIVVQIDYAGRSFQARSQLVYTNTEDVPLDSLYFRLLPNGGKSYGEGSLRVNRVTQDGQLVETSLSLDDSILEVKLGNPLDPGEQSQIGMDLNGSVPEGNGKTGYGIYSYAQGIMTLAGWYPQVAVYDRDGWNLDPVSAIGDSMYADMAFYTVDVTTNQNLVVATTGIEVDSQGPGAGKQFRFASGPVREFFLVLGENFNVESRTVDGTRLNSYSLRGNEAAGKMALGYAAEAVKHYNELFGRYPYRELDVVEAPMTYASGVEFPGIVLITESLYQSMRQPYFTYVVVHEVGHQWWYNVVGNDVFDDPWMDEGLTTYTGALYWEAANGSRAYQQSIDSFQSEYDRILKGGQDQPVTESLAYFEGLGNPGVYGAVVYEKGALFFHALRQEIGRTAFFKALRAYFQAYEYRIAQPEDLLAAFEQAAGRSLDAFYQEWLYSKQPGN